MMAKCYFHNCKTKPEWAIQALNVDGEEVDRLYYACGRHLDTVADALCRHDSVISVALFPCIMPEKPAAGLAERMTRVERRAELLKSSYDLNSDFLVRLTQRVIALEEQNERGAFRAGRLT